MKDLECLAAEFMVGEMSGIMSFNIITMMVIILPLIAMIVSIAFVVFVFRALLKYIRSGKASDRSETMKDQRETGQKLPLGDVLKAHRTRCNMTQEFVAEKVGVSRQAVSKWEKGLSEPSTSNLIALAKVFGVSVEELLKNVGNSEDNL